MTDDRRQLLSTFLDGELSPEVAAQVGRELSPQDQSYLEQLKANAERLQSADWPALPLGAQARWLREWQITRDRSVRRLASWMTVAAAVLLGVTLSTAMSRPAQAQPALADWETAAVAGVEDDDAPRTARLIAVDLSLPRSADVSREGAR